MSLMTKFMSFKIVNKIKAVSSLGLFDWLSIEKRLIKTNIHDKKRGTHDLYWTCLRIKHF